MGREIMMWLGEKPVAALCKNMSHQPLNPHHSVCSLNYFLILFFSLYFSKIETMVF